MRYNKYDKTWYDVLVEDMRGKVFTEVFQEKDKIILKNDIEVYTFYHQSECCEYVAIEEIIGSLKHLINTPLIDVRKETNEDIPAPNGWGDDYQMWTFYIFRTIKGDVTIRWFGSSNGYYSVDVDLKKQVQEIN